MVGSHVLGWNLPGQRPVFTLTEPVCCLFVKFPFSRPLKAQAPHQGETPAPLIVIVTMLIVDSLLSCLLHVREVCVHPFTLYPIPEVPPPLPSTPTTPLFPHLPNYHQRISCNPLMTPLLIVMYKIRYKTANFWCIFSIH